MQTTNATGQSPIMIYISSFSYMGRSGTVSLELSYALILFKDWDGSFVSGCECPKERGELLSLLS